MGRRSLLKLLRPWSNVFPFVARLRQRDVGVQVKQVWWSRLELFSPNFLDQLLLLLPMSENQTPLPLKSFIFGKRYASRTTWNLLTELKEMVANHQTERETFFCEKISIARNRNSTDSVAVKYLWRFHKSAHTEDMYTLHQREEAQTKDQVKACISLQIYFKENMHQKCFNTLKELLSNSMILAFSFIHHNITFLKRDKNLEVFDFHQSHTNIQRTYIVRKTNFNGVLFRIHKFRAESTFWTVFFLGCFMKPGIQPATVVVARRALCWCEVFWTRFQRDFLFGRILF